MKNQPQYLRLFFVALGGIVLLASLFFFFFRDENTSRFADFPRSLSNGDASSNTSEKDLINQKPSTRSGKGEEQNSSNAQSPESARETMAWVYPGAPSCAASNEYSDGRILDVLKPEYFSINESGELIFLTEENRGCNAYSPENSEKIRKFSREQFVTISSSYSKSMDIFITRELRDGENINRLIEFVRSNGFTGVELDFEDFGGWDSGMYDRYTSFVKQLGNALHAEGKKLMIDGPAIPGDEEALWYRWRYEDFLSLPVDRIVIMAYDYQFDHGAGSPIAPLDWMEKVLQRTVSKFPYVERLSVGIPSYGYEGILGSSQVTLLTYDQAKEKPGFETATRENLSGEMTWESGNTVYFYQDGESMNRKRTIAEKFGIFSVSVWHLGGNKWFAGK